LFMLTTGLWRGGATAARSFGYDQSVGGRVYDNVARLNTMRTVPRLFGDRFCLSTEKRAIGGTCEAQRWRRSVVELRVKMLYGLFRQVRRLARGI
jgi:hypothetical protein